MLQNLSEWMKQLLSKSLFFSHTLPLFTHSIRLAQMILDNKLSATLDQDTHCLTLTEEEQSSTIFDTSIHVMKGLSRVIDSLAVKASLLK